MQRFIVLACVALGLSACAYGDAELALGYNAETAKKGLISEAAATSLFLADVDDQRDDKERIGYKRNGFGQNTADIKSEKPPADIIKDALAVVLETNGHTLGASNERFSLETTLNNFWFDYKAGFVSVEFYGSIQSVLSLVDQSTGDAVYSETFDGYYSEKTGGGLSGTWTRIMNEAVADLVTKINLSPGFKQALDGIASANESSDVAADAAAGS